MDHGLESDRGARGAPLAGVGADPYGEMIISFEIFKKEKAAI